MPTILIVEDEIIIAYGIQQTLMRLGYQALEPVNSSDEALQVLSSQPVDLILMDINIKGDTDGIATALVIREQFGLPVVFLTALSDDTTLNRAKVARPYGYLLKPFDDKDLKTQLEIALYNYSQRETPVLVPRPEPSEITFEARYFFVRKGKNHVRLNLSDILFLEALENYVCIQTDKEQFVVYSTMKEVEQKLPERQFLKVHRSYVVNLEKIDGYEEGYVFFGKKAVPVSRSCKDELRKRIHLF